MLWGQEIPSPPASSLCVFLCVCICVWGQWSSIHNSTVLLSVSRELVEMLFLIPSSILSPIKCVFLHYILLKSLIFSIPFSISPSLHLNLFFLSSLVFPSSAGLPSATRQRWWRIRWTQCGRPLRSPFGLFAMAIMTGKSDSLVNVCEMFPISLTF